MKNIYIKKGKEEITLVDKDDIDYALDKKQDKEDAFSGSYTDLTDKPTIPEDYVAQNDVDTITLVITYNDDSTETIDFLISDSGV